IYHSRIRPRYRESPHAAPQRTPRPQLSRMPGPYAASPHGRGNICGDFAHSEGSWTAPCRAPPQSLTSMASRRPSLSRLNAIEVRKIITPGSIGTQVLTYMDCRSVFSIRPHSALGGEAPRPRKLRPEARMTLTLTRVLA